MSKDIKNLITPSPSEIGRYFGIPYRTALRWSQETETSWRRRLYVYMIDRYRKETKKD